MFEEATEDHIGRTTFELELEFEADLAAGIAEQSVKVAQFPQAVLDKFAAASGAILDSERAKGGNAEKGANMLTDFLKVLGYV